MSNISSWSTTAASNNSAAPNGAPEGMAPSGVNDVIRENMAATAKWYAALDGSLTTTGSANAYVLSTGSSHAALADIGLVVFKANFTNTGACTIAVDGLTAKSLYSGGSALSSGQIIQNQVYGAVYNTVNDVFDVVNASLDLSSLNTPVLSTRTSDTQLALADLGKFIKVTSGTFSQTFAAAATLGSGWFVYYYNSGSGTITLDPNSTETIDGASTLAMLPGEIRLIQSDGTNLNTLPIQTAGGWRLLSTTTASAASSVDIETGFGSTYDNYVIVLNGVTTSGDSAGFNAQMKLGGSYISTSTYYSASTNGTAGTSGATSGAIGGTFARTHLSGKISVHDVNSSLAKMIQSELVGYTSTPGVVREYYAVANSGTGALTGIRIAATAGTFSGDFQLFGITQA